MLKQGGSALLLALLWFLWPWPSAILAQEQDSLSQPSLEELDQELAQGTLSAMAYLDGANAWLDREFAQGRQYEMDSLMHKLANMRRLAWSADSLLAYRINYYINLSNNAVYAGRDGESIYFLEKAEQQIVKKYGQKPLLVAGNKCNAYIANQNYKRTIEVYEKERAYMQQFPELIRTGKLELNIGASFLNVLNPALQSYAVLGDTTGVKETLALSKAIYDALTHHKGWKPESPTAFIVGFYMKNLDYHQYFSLYKDRQKARKALADMEEALYGDTSKSASMVALLEPQMTPKMVDYFLTYGQNDSAAYYLEKLKHRPEVAVEHNYLLNIYQARLLANRGHYQEAFAQMQRVVADADSLQSVLVDDIDALFYARTAAEENEQALRLAEEQRNERTVWLFAVSILALLAIAVAYVLILRRNRQVQVRLEKLNQEANIQVAAMEEVRAQAVREEKKRLSRDLHDGLSASIAAANVQLSVLALECTPDMADKVRNVQKQIEQAYAEARGKSHEWYDAALGSEETDFEKRIQRVLDSALVQQRYHKEVHIDENALADVPFAVRIDLLRIVQEAITNIIKHAKAKHVQVLLYREDALLVLTVMDDGRGGKGKTAVEKSLGMQSMRDRAEQYGGQLAVQTGSTGFSVTVSIPI